MTHLLPRRWGFRLLGVLGIGAATALAACDTAGSGAPPTATTPTGGDPPPGVVLQVSYDETSTTTATRWPGDIAGGLKNDGDLLLHYSSAHQAYQFDDQGDLHSRVTYLEGNARTWLPEDFHETISDDVVMPGGADPVTSYEIDGGAVRALRASGEVAYEQVLPADAFRIPEEWVTALRTAQDSISQTSTRVSQNRTWLRENGATLQDLSDDRVAVSTTDGAGFTYRTVVDLRSGMPEVIETVQPDGLRASAELRTYQRFGTTPIATRVVTYHYGDSHGPWGVERKTVLTRTNVNVNQ